MKLKKYQDRELKIKKRTFMLLLFLCVVSIGLLMYQSYAKYQDKATFRIINGKLKMSGGKGDIEFAFYNGDQKLDTLPLKDSGSVFLKSVCTNNATVKWDSENWVPTVYNLTETKTCCELYFGSKEDSICSLYPESATCKYNTAEETSELLFDDTEDKNLRYVGATPNNYVYFNCEKGKEQSKETCEIWRIIGFMNNIEDEDGVVGSHIKIIRDKFAKNYSWDSSISGVNNGYGVNEWSISTIEKVLNDEYLKRHAGSNLCYRYENKTTEICPDWETVGIRDEARDMVANIKWHTGTIPVTYDGNTNLITASYMYEAERSNHNGKEICQASGEKYCNDDVDRTTTWIGKVGLMYPSDYGYAVGAEVREACLEKTMYSYKSGNCMTYNWLYVSGSDQWTITPLSHSSSANSVVLVTWTGSVEGSRADIAMAIRPTVYLKSDVKIALNTADDYGSVDNPFVLEYSEN